MVIDSLLLIMLTSMCLFLISPLNSSLLVSVCPTWLRTMWVTGCVFTRGLKLRLVSYRWVVGAVAIAMRPLRSRDLSLTRNPLIMCRTRLKLSVWKRTTVLTWPWNLGAKAPWTILTVLAERLRDAKLTECWVVIVVFVPAATIRTMPPKPVLCLPALASALWLTIRSRTPNMLGRVPLTLLSSRM